MKLKKTKLLVIIPTYWPEGSGGTLATHLIVKLLRDLNKFKITVLTGTDNPETIESVSYIKDPLLKRIDMFYVLPILLKLRYGWLLAEHDILYLVFAYPFIPVAKMLGKKVIVHLHDYGPISPCNAILAEPIATEWNLVKQCIHIKFKSGDLAWIIGKILYHIIRVILIRNWLTRSDAIITVSKKHARIITKYIPHLAKKIRIVRNPYHYLLDNVFLDSPKHPLIVYVGGDSYIKGFPFVIKLMKHMSTCCPNVSIVLTGSYRGEVIKMLYKLCERYNIKLEVLGRISHEHILKLYNIALALLFPSITEEPSPYAVIEAGLSGAIPIAFKVGGVEEILGDTIAKQFTIEPLNINDMLRTIEEVIRLNDSERIRIAQDISIKLRSMFDIEKIKISLMKLFREVIFNEQS